MTRGPTPHATPKATREAIRAEALRLGFASCGFAPAEPPAHADAYLEWLRRGHHGEMAWMAREDAVRRRLDPREALPGCRTLIVVAWSYAPGSRPGAPGSGPGTATGRDAADARSFTVPPDAPPSAEPGEGVIARYALGRDYHALFEERLGRLAEAVRAREPDAACKLYVDYGPVLERDHAQRAGLGWIGKNTLLIDPRRGSYLLLGEILTDLALEPDPPFEVDRCGSCTRCLEACPTGAIVAPREVDARLCISYLTIELRGPIPLELRPLVGNRVFGCDICQEVCPWNSPKIVQITAERDYRPRVPRLSGSELDRGAGTHTHPHTHTGPTTDSPSLVELMRMTREEWDLWSRGSAIRRAGYAGFRRNVAVAMGNWFALVGQPPEDALAVLRDALEDEEPLVREHAAWALGRVKCAEAQER